MEPLFGLLGKKPAKADAAGGTAPAQPAAGADTIEEAKLRLYKLIIDRYRDKIEEYETKSVSDLKLLIQPRHPLIAKIKEAISENFHPYIYEENFLPSAKMAFSHVAAFKSVSAPVPFWLTLEEIQELMAGDEIDKSIFLCSILRSLGSENAKVFLTDTQNSYVLFQYMGKSYVADHSKGELVEKQSGKDALDSLQGKLLYAFNDREYEDFQESEDAF
ncbi:MAG: hypothetical protein WCT52_03140 [Candidatus Micrarchaeia archaeon]|jgi:hypothetical protein